MTKFQGKETCWERMGCGRDRQKDCPAYPDYGRLCWPIAGTKCPTGARRGPLRPDEPIAQDETVVGGTPENPGRLLRVRGHPRP